MAAPSSGSTEDAGKGKAVHVPVVSKTSKMHSQVLELTRGMRSRMMATAREKITQSAVEDPDIWPCARSLTTAVVEQFLIDLEHEIEQALELAVYYNVDGSNVPGPSGEGLLQKAWFRTRAFTLYHYLPFNKSIYGKFKDPVYVAMYLLTLIPVHGVRVVFFTIILAMLLQIPQPPDEHQLINYILIFKGMQFLTQGFLYMCKGAGFYYVCYSFHKSLLLECIDESGPGAAATWGQLLDYLGSVALVWVTFYALPRAKRFQQNKRKNSLKEPLLAEEVQSSQSQHGHGRLRRLLYYDVICFVISVVLLCLLTALTNSDQLFYGLPTKALLISAQFHANIYWSCVLYSMASLPFMLYAIPGLQKVLTHSVPTGHNRHGACVVFELPLTTASVQKQPKEPKTSTLGNFATSAAAGIQKKGAKMKFLRGGEGEGDHKRGDFARGLWANVTEAVHKKSAGSADAGKSAGSADAAEVAPAASAAPVSVPSARFQDTFRQVKNRLMGKETESENEASNKVAAGIEVLPPPIPVHPGEMLPISSVRVLQGEDVQIVRVISVSENPGGENWQVQRQYSDFVLLASVLGAKVLRETGPSGDMETQDIPQLPPPSSAGVGDESASCQCALGDWLAVIVADTRCQSKWANDMREFLGLDGAPSTPLPKQTIPAIQVTEASGDNSTGDVPLAKDEAPEETASTPEKGPSSLLNQQDAMEEKSGLKTLFKVFKGARGSSPAKDQDATAPTVTVSAVTAASTGDDASGGAQVSGIGRWLGRMAGQQTGAGLWNFGRSAYQDLEGGEEEATLRDAATDKSDFRKDVPLCDEPDAENLAGISKPLVENPPISRSRSHTPPVEFQPELSKRGRQSCPPSRLQPPDGRRHTQQSAGQSRAEAKQRADSGSDAEVTDAFRQKTQSKSKYQPSEPLPRVAWPVQSAWNSDLGSGHWLGSGSTSANASQNFPIEPSTISAKWPVPSGTESQFVAAWPAGSSSSTSPNVDDVTASAPWPAVQPTRIASVIVEPPRQQSGPIPSAMEEWPCIVPSKGPEVKSCSSVASSPWHSRGSSPGPGVVPASEMSRPPRPATVSPWPVASAPETTPYTTKDGAAVSPWPSRVSSPATSTRFAEPGKAAQETTPWSSNKQVGWPVDAAPSTEQWPSETPPNTPPVSWPAQPAAAVNPRGKPKTVTTPSAWPPKIDASSSSHAWPSTTHVASAVETDPVWRGLSKSTALSGGEVQPYAAVQGATLPWAHRPAIPFPGTSGTPPVPEDATRTDADSTDVLSSSASVGSPSDMAEAGKVRSAVAHAVAGSAEKLSTTRAAIKDAINDKLGSEAVTAARAALDERIGGFRQRASEASKFTSRFGSRKNQQVLDEKWTGMDKP